METKKQENSLQKEYKFWFSKSKENKKNMSKEDFEMELRDLPAFSSVENFWGLYMHMKRPSELEVGSKLFLFQSKIRPLWEDELNKNGGRFYIRAKKERADKIWEDLILGYIGENLEYNDAICGLQLASRPENVIVISIWTQNIKGQVREDLIQIFRKYLHIPSTIKVEYQDHPRSRHNYGGRRGNNRTWENERRDRDAGFQKRNNNGA